jgi:hypothetical protein
LERVLPDYEVILHIVQLEKCSNGLSEDLIINKEDENQRNNYLQILVSYQVHFEHRHKKVFIVNVSYNSFPMFYVIEGHIYTATYM